MALAKFLKKWPHKKETAGVLVCGSYVTGDPSPRSDVDVHIVLKEGTKWRERGNRIVDGIMIEYFSNPPEQILQYFQEDYKNGRQMSVTQFLTGRVLYDDGSIKRLAREAKKWHSKKLKKPSGMRLSMIRYGIWDMCDNLHDAYDHDAKHFWFVYHCTLNHLIEIYCSMAGYPMISYHKSFDILDNPAVRAKYLLPDFPDKIFMELMKRALVEKDAAAALRLFDKLADHVHKKAGGFHIDGWRLKSPVKC